MVGAGVASPPVVADDPVGSAGWVRSYGRSANLTCRRAQLELALRDERVFSLEGDLGDCGGEEFAELLPRRFVDFGIAEANMVGAAAGLALRGKIPFVNTFASFALMRACEQVRVDVCYHRANVKFAGMFAGVAAGASGPTHHCIEDLAIARAFPNMVVIAPADAVSAYLATLAAAAHVGPVYLRLGMDATPLVYGSNASFEIGKGVVLSDGDDVAIVAAGLSSVASAVAAGRLLSDRGVAAMVIDMATIKPIDRDLITRVARSVRLVVTVEEHSVCAGLGGAVAEVLAEAHPRPLHRIGIPDAYCKEVGPYEEHLRRYGLDAEGIARAVEAKLRDARRGE